MERKIPATLVTLIAQEYGLRVRTASAAEPSDEAVAWRAEADRPLFIHQSPLWRTSEELSWVHGLVASVARTFPQTVTPLARTNGATFVEHDGALITLYPFVAGPHLDREDAAQREAAACLRAELHRVLLTCDAPPRPQPGPQSPWRASNATRGLPPELEDRELDDWHAALLRRADVQRGLVHGDYHRRNLLWSAGRVVAVVDWHEARHDLLLAEVASATWEFSKDATSRGFSIERAHAFLDAYANAHGPAEVRDRSLMVPLIRWRLRQEALLSLALEARGLPADVAYSEAVTASFDALRSLSL